MTLASDVRIAVRTYYKGGEKRAPNQYSADGPASSAWFAGWDDAGTDMQQAVKFGDASVPRD